MGEILKDRHGGNGQILFLDSHTESVPWTDWVANIPDQGWASGPPPTAELGKTWTVINDNQ
jgi:prepilin-type processing-associated H-X9-DG protein